MFVDCGLDIFRRMSCKHCLSISLLCVYRVRRWLQIHVPRLTYLLIMCL